MFRSRRSQKASSGQKASTGLVLVEDESRFPTFVVVVSNNGAKDAKVADISREFGAQVINTDRIRVATLTELQDPNYELKSTYCFVAGGYRIPSPRRSI